MPSCITCFWHGVIPTSYLIFKDFYTCLNNFFLHCPGPHSNLLFTSRIKRDRKLNLSIYRHEEEEEEEEDAAKSIAMIITDHQPESVDDPVNDNKRTVVYIVDLVDLLCA